MNYLIEKWLSKLCGLFGYFLVPNDTPERMERMSKTGYYPYSEAISDLKVLRDFHSRAKK